MEAWPLFNWDEVLAKQIVASDILRQWQGCPFRATEPTCCLVTTSRDGDWPLASQSRR
jgi:hypothetical protein